MEDPRGAAGRASADRTGTVVVGVDGSPGARAALLEALRIAEARHARLRVVAAYDPPPPHRVGEAPGVPYGAWPPVPSPSRAAVEAAVPRRTRAVVEEVVCGSGTYPAHRGPIEVEALPGHPVAVLVDAAADADELVVGHRGRGALASAALGSVGLGCVLHASCPVTVVPSRTQHSSAA